VGETISGKKGGKLSFLRKSRKFPPQKKEGKRQKKNRDGKKFEGGGTPSEGFEFGRVELLRERSVETFHGKTMGKGRRRLKVRESPNKNNPT